MGAKALPEAESYADAYDRRGILGPRTVMAHVVYPEESEIALLRNAGDGGALPASNMTNRSGIAPCESCFRRA